MLYNNLSGYFRRKYGTRLSKICIDGGFSCPNRDGTCGTGGCIFCGERGAGEHIDPALSIREQIEKALVNADPCEKFVAYFQNFTNTYADAEMLKERYDAALTDERIIALAIGTRPDCIDEDVAALIASYKERCDVWVELGLQTANDKTAELINRGYKTAVFERAVKILDKYGIDIVAHIIVGLPDEGLPEVAKTVDFLTRLPLSGLKIHSIYVMEGTRLADMYRRGEYTPPTLEEYIEAAIYILTHISPDIIIHRLTGDCPRELLLAPEWNSDKHKIINLIANKLSEMSFSQGSLYKS